MLRGLHRAGRRRQERAAKALIHDLGVSEFGVRSLSAAKLRIEEVERLFQTTFRYRPMAGCPWNILLVEEAEKRTPPPVRRKERRRRGRPEQPRPETETVAGRRTRKHPANPAPLGARLPAGATRPVCRRRQRLNGAPWRAAGWAYRHSEDRPPQAAEGECGRTQPSAHAGTTCRT